MLPNLSKLGHDTAVPRDDSLKLKDLPQELRLRMLELTLDGIGVPLMLIRYRNPYKNIAFLRLPDPAKHELDAEFLFQANYPFSEIIAGVVELAEYDASTSITKFVDVRSDYEQLPEQLDHTDAHNFGNDHGPTQPYDVYEMAKEVTKFSQSGKPTGYFFQRPPREQIVFNKFPAFKSHVAIVLDVF